MRAGAIAAEARDFGIKKVAEGGSSLALANEIEALIRERGAKCAFPVNIGVNDVAAHYTPSIQNPVIFRHGDVVKIDVGAHIDGYPADTSATVEVGTRNNSGLIECANDALRICIEMAAPGTPVSAIGGAVARTIRSAGFKPVENLTGHSMAKFNLHAGLSVPNIDNNDRSTLKEGMVVAIEPFSTTGSGRVSGKGKGGIFRIIRERKAPPEVLELFGRIKDEFGLFPFAGRWCDDLHPDAQDALVKMVRLGMVMSYDILRENSGGVVAQAEHSIIVLDGGCRTIT